MLTTDEFNGEDILVDEQADTAAQAEQEVMLDKLRCAMRELDEDEKLLIYRYYYAEIPTTKLAKMYGISHQAVSKRSSKSRENWKILWKNKKFDCSLLRFFGMESEEAFP